MFWPNIFLSLRGTKSSVCHCEPAEGRRGNLKTGSEWAPQSQSGYRKLVYPKEKYTWAQVTILHETEKAILIDNGMKIWIPKSQIYGIRLKNNIFEVYVKESTVA